MTQSIGHVDAPRLPASALRWTGGRLLLTLLIAGALVWGLLTVSDSRHLLAAASGLWGRPDLVGFFVLTYTAAFYLRAVAWRLLLLTPSVSILRLFSALQIALFVNHAFPTKAGELVRIYLLCRRGVPFGQAAATTALSRLLDFAAVCGIAVVLGLLAGSQPDLLVSRLALPIAVVAGAGLLCVVAVRRRWERLESRLPARVAAVIQGVRSGIAEIRPSRLGAATLLVIPSWLLEAGAVWSVAQAVGVDLSWQVAAAATAFTIAFQGFQVTPGGIGVYEASLTAVLALFGIDPAVGLALAVTTHALKFIYSYVAGFLCLLPEGLDAIGLAGRSGSAVGPGPTSETWRDVAAELRRSIGRVRRWGDPYLVVALAGIAVGYAWSSMPAPAWLGIVVGAVAAVPLVLIALCHHLPGRARPLLLLVPVVFLLLAGLPAPEIGGLALMGSAAIVVWRRAFSLEAIVWPAFLSQAIVWNSAHPLAGLLLGAVAFTGIVLIRQWWQSARPLPPTGPVPAGATVAVLIPVRNEEPTIGRVVADIPRDVLAARGYRTTVIVVDDGSTDRSAAVAEAAGADLIVRHQPGRGLGAAVRSGITAARELGAQAAVYLDGDGEYDPADLPAMVEPVLRGEADYVLGNRFPQAGQVMRFSRYWGNRAFTLAMCLLTGRWIRDAQTGYRAFSVRALACAEIIHDYNYAQVLTLDLLRKRMRLAQVEIRYQVRTQGTSFIRYRTYAQRVLPAIARELLSP